MRRREFIALRGAPAGWLRLKLDATIPADVAKAIATYVRDAGSQVQILPLRLSYQ
jgi:hypothetical protein